MIDIEKVKEYTGADEEFISSLYRKFESHLDEDLKVLRIETGTANWGEVRKKVHAMLSSARIFFLNDIVELSMNIEAKVDAEEYNDLPKMVDDLINLYQAFQKEGQTLFASSY